MSTSTQTDMAQPRHIPPKQDNPIVQEERKHEGAAVKAALAANVGVAIAKLGIHAILGHALRIGAFDSGLHE